MIIQYRPDEGPQQEFDFRPGDFGSYDSEAIEVVGGQQWGTFEEWGAMFFRGSQRARRAALWVMLRRANPRLRFQDVSFRADQVDVTYSMAEREAIINTMLADPDLDAEQRAHLSAVVAVDSVDEVDRALERAGTAPGDHGIPKDLPPSSEGDGSTSQPQA